MEYIKQLCNDFELRLGWLLEREYRKHKFEL